MRDVHRNASGHLAHRPAPTFEKVPRLIGGRYRHTAGSGRGSSSGRQQQLEEDVQTEAKKRMERLVSFSPSTRELVDALCPLERTRSLGFITYRL